jgi:hypothetical protein
VLIEGGLELSVGHVLVDYYRTSAGGYGLKV